MIASLGPAQAVAISPFCTLKDITNWAPVHRITFSALEADVVWRTLLVSHFQPVFNCLVGLQESSSPPEKLAAELPGEALKEAYLKLQKTLSECPFALMSRDRLLLEIHELREWDRHRKQFLLKQQTARLAAALGDSEAVERLRVEMAPPALELVSLQTMMGDGRAIRLSQLQEVQWSQSAEKDLRQLMDKRLQQRRTWWQRQREYLLQDMNHGV